MSEIRDALFRYSLRQCARGQGVSKRHGSWGAFRLFRGA